MKIKEEVKKGIGLWLWDVAKYVLTAAVVTSFLGEINQKWLYYGVGAFVIGLCFFLGLIIQNKD